MIENNKNGLCMIHNVRFYNLAPRSISYLSYNSRTCKLAVSRGDASIEIWDMRFAPYMEKSILGSTDASVESLGWVDERLFSTGLTGKLTEWNLKTLSEERSVMLTGNSAWCLDVTRSNDHIAVGTEEGYLNIFEVADNSLNYVKILDKQEGRILCAKYDHTGSFIVTGSMDTVRVWNVKTGHAIFRMATGRAEAKKPTTVWSIAVLKDMTIISGDSRGRVTVWDGKIGVQIDSFTVLRADVLSVAVNEEENTFCCSGIDPLIKMFVLTPMKKDNQITHKWIKFIQRAVHDHDVKSLVFAGQKVISGSVDGYLGLSYSTKSKQKLTKYGPFLQQPCAIITEKPRLLLLKYFNYIEVWRLGKPSETVQLCEDESDKGTFMSLEEHLEKLVELRSRDDEPIVCSALSGDGTWLVYSTSACIRIFKIDTLSSQRSKLNRIKDVPDQFSPCNRIIFSSNSKSIFLVKNTGFIDVFDLSDDEEMYFKERINVSKVVKDTICNLIISKCGKYLVAVGTCCSIAVWTPSGTKNTWQHLLNLPKYHVPPTALAIHQNCPRLVAAFPDSKIFEYDLEEMKFTCSANKNYISNTSDYAVNNIVLDPRNENVFLLHNDKSLYVLEKTKASRNAKDARVNVDQVSDIEVSDFKLKFRKDYEHFVHLSWLSTNEMVAVGVNPITLVEQLPPSLRQKKFGAS